MHAPDVKIIEVTGDVRARLEYVHGVQPVEDESYESGAWVPREAWRSWSPEVPGPCIAGPEQLTGADFGHSVALVRLKDSSLFPLYDLELTTISDPNEFLDRRAKPAVQKALGELREHVLGEFGLRREASQGLLGMTSPGLTTTTVDHRHGKFIGIHLDNWSDYPLTQRHQAQNRITINVGLEARYFVFLPVSFREIVRRVKERGRRIPDHQVGTNVGRQFLSAWPDSVVWRLRFEPGEAYMGATENILHDGSTLGGGYCSFSLVYHGFFSPAPRSCASTAPF